MVDLTRERLLFEVWGALKGVVWSLAPRPGQPLEEAGCTPAQAGLLRMLLEAESPYTPQEIARRLEVTPATVTGTLNRLEEAGLIARVRESADRRVVHVHVTPAGREMEARWRRLFGERLAELMVPLSDQELATLVALASRIATPIHGPPGGFGAILKHEEHAHKPSRATKRRGDAGKRPRGKRS